MNSKKWWNLVKNDSKKLNDWLIKQYRGEITAADRIIKFAETYAPNKKSLAVLNVIAKQEKKHAKWVLELLKNRNIIPNIENAEDRYWKETLPEIESFEIGAAIGAHAEKMRLERIRVISGDETAPKDIRNTFKKILKDEIFHEKIFKSLTTIKALNETKNAHEQGLKVLGLEP